MKINELLNASILLAMACVLPSSDAVLITYAGAISDNAGAEISDWRTAATIKTFDADGDNQYGTDALLFYTVQGPQLGDYVSYVTSQLQVGPFTGYASVDAPDGLSDIQVRTTTSQVADPGLNVGVLHDMFTFQIQAGVPAAFRVGIALDGLDGAHFTGSDLTLVQTAGGSASATTATVANNTIDMYFFDVWGAAVGEQYTVRGTSGAGGFATHQIVTWDTLSAVPEPSTSIPLMVLGGFAFFLRRRKTKTNTE